VRGVAQIPQKPTKKRLEIDGLGTFAKEVGVRMHFSHRVPIWILTVGRRGNLGTRKIFKQRLNRFVVIPPLPLGHHTEGKPLSDLRPGSVIVYMPCSGILIECRGAVAASQRSR